MYRKSTLFQTELANYEENHAIAFSRHHGMTHSSLVLNDSPNSLYQYYEINMPYLILYESIHPQNNLSEYIEFTENSFLDANMPYSEYLKSASVKLHSHDFYELTFVMSGELTMHIEDDYITYHAGECCLCNKNIHHAEQMNPNTEIVLFLLKEDYVKDVFENNFYYDRDGISHSIGSVFHQFFDENKKISLYNAKIYTDFRLIQTVSNNTYLSIINQMIKEISSRHSGKSHMMKALFCRFIEMLCDTDFYETRIHRAKLSNDEQIIYQIANAYQNKKSVFTRNEIEQITGYNSDYVERILKRSIGKTLSEYGRSFLLKNAADMLLHTDHNIGKICESLGYSNRNYFNQIFRQEYGVSPSQYRKAVKNNPLQSN